MPACEALLKIGGESGAVQWHAYRAPREALCAGALRPTVHPTGRVRVSETVWDAVKRTSVGGLAPNIELRKKSLQERSQIRGRRR